MALHTEHLSDLQKSGLTDQTIETAGICTVPPGQINKIMGWDAPITSMLTFPYPGNSGFTRYRLFPPYQKKGETRAQKYWQPKGSGVHLYRPPGFDPGGDVILITEGEKKALKACQDGLNCCALGGIWNFAVKDENGKPQLIDDFNSIDWIDRKVELVPDSDFLKKEEVKHGVYRLGTLLEQRGTSVSVVCLPPGEKLDDYLCKHTSGEFDNLKRINLEYKLFKGVKKKEEKPKPAPTIADTLIAFAGKGVDFFFTDQYDTPYARFSVNGHSEHWPIRSKIFRSWLQRLYYQAKGKGANSDGMNQALDTIEAIAQFDGKGEIELHNRVCKHDGAYWYDLTNDQWQTIRITETGWQVINDPPVMFRRLTHQKPQVIPDKSGTLEALNPFLVGIKKEKHKTLLKVWIASCFLPDFPHTIPVPYGEQGSGKTSVSKLMKGIIDPSVMDVLGGTGDRQEIIQNLSHHWLLAYDNLSSLSKETQNIFCRAVTGAAYSKRKLYTDDEDSLTYTRNCLILSGINYPATAPDLLDRCILIELRNLSRAGVIIKEEVLKQKTQEAIPSILGGVFNTLVKAIQIKKALSLTNLPRMADWTEWGYAIAEVTGSGGQSFLDAYRENIGLRNQEIISSNPVASTLASFMEDREIWIGTPSDLLGRLTQLMPEDEKKDRSWPKTANVLVRRMNELKSNLSDAGIEIERNHGKETTLKITTFQQVGENTVAIVATVFPKEKQGFADDDMPTILSSADDTEKIPSQPKLLKTQQKDDTDDKDDKKPHLLEKDKNKKEEVFEDVRI